MYSALMRLGSSRTGSERVRSNSPMTRSRRCTLTPSGKVTTFLPETRIVFSLAWICRSFLSIPGSSMMAMRSGPCWNTLIGGKAPRLAVEFLKPVARQLSFECSLEAKQRVKRIGKCRDHVRTPRGFR